MNRNQQEKVSRNLLAGFMLEMAMIFLGGVLITSIIWAGEASVGTRETLKQYIAELQKDPDNQELREKIIKLALTLDPAPAVPEEAHRLLVKANIALREAKSAENSDRAIKHYNEALLLAPWLAEAYYNLAEALKLRQRYGDAIRNYQLYLLAAPNAEDIRTVKDKIYELEEKEEQAQAMVFIKGGCFDMGDTFGDGEPDEKPVHTVCVDDFYIEKYEVTVGEFRKFSDETGYRTEAERGDGCFYWDGKKVGKDKSISWRNPGFSQTDRHPVVCVSWNDAVEYTRWISQKTGKNFRLPTEAEWEYAARSGGKNYKYSWGNGSPSGNIADEAAKRQFPSWTVWSGYDDGYVYTTPVGSFKPNDLGLYDMTGNVWEWVNDWYDEGYYKNSPKDNPKGPLSGTPRVLRGGGWTSNAGLARAANRNGGVPGYRDVVGGCRLARTR